MANEEKKKKFKDSDLPTVKTRNKYKALNVGLKVGSYTCCVVPFTAELGVHWQEWFGQSDNSNKVSIGVGFGMLLVSTLATMVAVMSHDKEFMKKYSPMFYVAILVACWAASFLFLSSIMNEMGMMLMYTAMGVAGGAVTDEVNIVTVKPMVKKYDKLIADYGLTNKSAKDQQAIAQAKKDQAERKSHPVD